VLTYNEIKVSEYFKDDYYLYVVFDQLQRQGKPELNIRKPLFRIVDKIISKEYIVPI
jgi:hypothetical protein